MVYGPVADVNNNHENRLIMQRSFGSDPEMVARFVGAYVEGMTSAGVIPTLKHFPGHGSAVEDSHLEMAFDFSTREMIENNHLVPFREGFRAGAGAVMTGHVVMTAIDKDRPATLSHAVLTTLLREELKFDGMLITDSLNMHSIRKQMGQERSKSAVDALIAGADLILHPGSLYTVLQGILEAIEDGCLSMERLNSAVKRILYWKRLPLKQCLLRSGTEF